MRYGIEHEERREARRGGGNDSVDRLARLGCEEGLHRLVRQGAAQKQHGRDYQNPDYRRNNLNCHVHLPEPP